MNMRNKSGFTLLEVIIVVIIIGVLASLALPKFFSTAEYARGSEALRELSTLRQSMDRCFVSANTYTGCDISDPTDPSFQDSLDVENPNSVADSDRHFGYAITPAGPAYTILATRNTTDGGVATDTISITERGIKTGTGKYAGIK